MCQHDMTWVKCQIKTNVMDETNWKKHINNWKRQKGRVNKNEGVREVKKAFALICTVWMYTIFHNISQSTLWCYLCFILSIIIYTIIAVIQILSLYLRVFSVREKSVTKRIAMLLTFVQRRMDKKCPLQQREIAGTIASA